jgi:hypothetical protein
LHLKPGAHISYRYDYDAYGETGLGSALFQFNETIAPGDEISLSLQVTSEDNTNTISNINMDYVTPAHSSFIAWVNHGHKMSFDNVTIIDNPAISYLNGADREVAIVSFFVNSFAKLTLRNTHLRTSNKYAQYFDETVGFWTQTSMANVTQGLNPLDFGESSIVEVINSNITLYCVSDSGDEHIPVIRQFFASLKAGEEDEPLSMVEIRLRNSNFVNANNFNATDISFVEVEGSLATIYVDDCVIFRGFINYGTTGDEVTYPLSAYAASGTVFKSATGTSNSIYFVARNVHNYTAGNYLYGGGTWYERSGVGRSQAALGVSGFGLCEFYLLLRPYDWIEFP